MEHPAQAQTIARPPEDCKLSLNEKSQDFRGNSLEISKSSALGTEITTSGSTLTPSGHLGQHPHYNHPQFQEAIRYSLERGLLYFIWDGAAIWVNGVRS